MTSTFQAPLKAPSSTLWTSVTAAQATGGKTNAEWYATGISIDSRTIQPGDLYIALKGKNSDGHAYVAKALAAGAAAAMVSERPADVAEDAPLLMVENTLSAMELLGAASRHRTSAVAIAVTGSVGKTGTKEMLATAFGVLGQTHASKASHNNHWGVPLSLASMHAGCDYGIFEVGMNHSGEIIPLSKQVKPDIAIITTVEPVHIANFSGIEEIADAKAEIFSGMDHTGTAIINRDNSQYARIAAAAKTQGVNICTFGEHEESDAQLLECVLAANGTRVKARIMGKDLSFTLLIPGHHIAMNALAVLLAVHVSGGDIEKAARALETIQALAGRGRRDHINIGDAENPVVLIDESYNASPVAMKAAFRVLAMIDPGRGGRRIAVLGDMYELGSDAAKLHRELALPLQAAGVSLVYTCGPLMKNLYDALPEQQRGAHRDDNVELAQIVPDVLRPGDVVMVKGSRGAGEKPRMQVIVEAMRALPDRLNKNAAN